jgi:hypothetical protein
VICTQESANKQQPNLKAANERFIAFFGGGKFLGEPELSAFFDPDNI